MTLSYHILKTVYSAQRRGVIIHATLQAIMKKSYIDAFPGTEWKNLDVPNIFYHVEGRRFSDVLDENEIFTVLYFSAGLPKRQLRSSPMR